MCVSWHRAPRGRAAAVVSSLMLVSAPPGRPPALSTESTEAPVASIHAHGSTLMVITLAASCITLEYGSSYFILDDFVARDYIELVILVAAAPTNIKVSQ